MQMELRSNKVELSSNGNDLIVSGYVNKPGELSELLGGSKKFRERILPGAFKAAIENRSKEIEFLAEHNIKKILSSTSNGSLELREEDEGLYMAAKITPTTYGRDYYELIKSGLISSMSFGFRALKDSWQHVEGIAIRTVEQLELFEVSAVKEPAYTQSTIAARGIDLVEKIEVPDEEQITNERGNQNMEMLMEKRTSEFTEMLKGETRSLQTTAEGANLIPKQVANEIVLKMEETSPIFAKVRKIGSVAGSLRVTRENDAVVAGFVGEGEDVLEGAIDFRYVDLKQKRVGAALTLSKQLINDTAVNVEEYAKNLLARRTAKAIERSILTGNGDLEFNGIVNDAAIKSVDAENAVTMDKLAELHLTILPEFLTGASFIMNRTVFNEVAKMRDNNGHAYIQNGVVNGKFQYNLFGFPVEITEALPDTNPVLFGNFDEAYSVMVKQEQGLTEVAADTKNAMAGTKLFVFDSYMDGAVTNPQAIAKLIVTA
jgi:HK97 family phage major capsid protein/HK97 family phage prohead protease